MNGMTTTIGKTGKTGKTTYGIEETSISPDSDSEPE